MHFQSATEPDRPADAISAVEPGGLYVVATPIGNLADITLRALRVLQDVDLIAAEDTRHTGRLLSHYQIKNRLLALHEHNEARQTPALLARLDAGAAIALATDAGTPTVSDPGYRLVRAAVNAGCKIIPIPGVCAATTALSVSGLPTDAFVFVGFIARKSGKRRTQLDALSGYPQTLIFYESPRRVQALLDDLLITLGDRPAMLGREMTKFHEEFLHGRLSEIRDRLQSREDIKGEITLLVGGAAPGDMTIDRLIPELAKRLAEEGTGLAQLAKQMAAETGLSRKTIYAEALKLRGACP